MLHLVVHIALWAFGRHLFAGVFRTPEMPPESPAIRGLPDSAQTALCTTLRSIDANSAYHSPPEDCDQGLFDLLGLDPASPPFAVSTPQARRGTSKEQREAVHAAWLARVAEHQSGARHGRDNRFDASDDWKKGLVINDAAKILREDTQRRVYMVWMDRAGGDGIKTRQMWMEECEQQAKGLWTDL